MKHQKVVLDNWTLVYSTLSYLLLAFSGWVLLRLVIACFKYPRFVRNLKRMQEQLDKAEDTIAVEDKKEKERIDLSIKDDDTCTGLGQQCPPPTVRIEKSKVTVRLFGVLVGNNCQISLPAFGVLFLFIGIVLTIVGFKGSENEAIEAREETTRNIRILGPVCVLVGLSMLGFAVLLKYLSRKAEEKDIKIGFYCPVHGDFYPLSPEINPRKYSFSELTHDHKWWTMNCLKKHDSTEPIIPADIPCCPHSMSTSNRSSFDGQHIQITNPNPHTVIITTASISDKSISRSVSSERDLNSGSVRSISIPNDVVSFPSFRSRSNPPTLPPSPMFMTPSTAKRLSCPLLPEVGAVSPLQIEKLTKFTPVLASVKTELKVVKPAADESQLSPHISNTSIHLDDDSKKRKSVSILLPPDKYHTQISN